MLKLSPTRLWLAGSLLSATTLGLLPGCGEQGSPIALEQILPAEPSPLLYATDSINVGINLQATTAFGTGGTAFPRSDTDIPDPYSLSRTRNSGADDLIHFMPNTSVTIDIASHESQFGSVDETQRGGSGIGYFTQPAEHVFAEDLDEDGKADVALLVTGDNLTTHATVYWGAFGLGGWWPTDYDLPFLAPSKAGEKFTFTMAKNRPRASVNSKPSYSQAPDLFGIRRGSSGFYEVSSYIGAKGSGFNPQPFQRVDLIDQRTPIPNDVPCRWVAGHFGGAPQPDLACILTNGTTGKVEIHMLYGTGAAPYARFWFQAATQFAGRADADIDFTTTDINTSCTGSAFNTRCDVDNLAIVDRRPASGSRAVLQVLSSSSFLASFPYDPFGTQPTMKASLIYAAAVQ